MHRSPYRHRHYGPYYEPRGAYEEEVTSEDLEDEKAYFERMLKEVDERLKRIGEKKGKR